MRRLPVYLLLDTSGSMFGEPIEAVKNGVQVLVSTLRQDPYALETAYLSIITFDSTAQQVVPLTELSTFQQPNIEANGCTALGEALALLAAKVDVEVTKTTAEVKGDWKPLVFIMTDGEPTDDAAEGLEKLKNNNWYKAAIKVAIAIGDDAEKSVLEEFAGNSEAVLTVHNIDQLKKIIRYVSVTASKVASKTTSVGKDAPETKNEENIQNLKKVIQDDPTLSGIDTGSSTANAGTDDWTGW